MNIDNPDLAIYTQLILFIVANILLLVIAGWLWRQGNHEIWYKLEEKYSRKENVRSAREDY